jgi:hypothetical protein
MGRHVDRLAGPQHGRRRRGHLPQRIDGALGLVLLHEPEHDREEHDDRDHDCLGRVPERRRQRDGDQQDEDQHVA